LAFVLFGHVVLNFSDGEILFQVRAQKMPYLTNVEENELKRLKTTTDERNLGDEELLAAKGTRGPLLGIGAIVAHSFPSNYWTV
jgi:hypothetical protein